MNMINERQVRLTQEVIDAIGLLLESVPFPEYPNLLLLDEWKKSHIIRFGEISPHNISERKREFAVIYVGSNPDPNTSSSVIRRSVMQELKDLLQR